MNIRRLSMVTAATFIALSLLVGTRSAEAKCEICRWSGGDNVKLCQQVFDVPGWRNGRTDCVDTQMGCPPGDCCYLSQKLEFACSVNYPAGCPNPRECGIKDVQEKDI